jgi:hypothetical protein
MVNSVASVFGRPIIESPQQQAQRVKAAQGFTQVFAAILAKQMRESTVGADSGPMGTGGGITGDVYGAFFDQALAGVIAKSPVMRDLNSAIVRKLGDPTQPSTSHVPNLDKTIAHIPIVVSLNDNLSSTGDGPPAIPAPASISSLSTSDMQDPAMTSDQRGPVLLPPKPSTMAFFLPPPLPLEK